MSPSAQLVIRGPRGYAKVAWSDYVRLRDDVQEQLENGAPSERFSSLHALERAFGARFALVEAARLRREVLDAWQALQVEPISSVLDGDQARLAAQRFLRAVLTSTEEVGESDKLLIAYEPGPIP
jgi:hypothetical protein